MFREICLFAGAHAMTTKYIMIAVPLIKLSIPYFVRYMEYGNPFFFSWDSIIYSATEFLPYSFYTFANFLFVLAGFIDFQRRVFIIRAVGSLINPFKQDIPLKYHIFPTVMVTCKHSINTWF